MSEVRVTGRNVYPIKSCRGVSLDEVNIVPTGLEYDRLFMLIDKNNRFISQRNRPYGPKLTQVKTSFGEYSGPLAGKNNGFLNVNIKDFGDLKLSLFLPPHHREEDKLPKGVRRKRLDLVESSIHKDTAVGAVVGKQESDFFAEFLGEEGVRLIRSVGSHVRQIKQDRQIKGASPFTGFADGFPVLLTSAASLRKLNRHPAIAAEFKEGISMNRFRPGIEVDGDELEANDEDFWRFIKIGSGLGAWVAKPCVRCVIPETDQESGEVSRAVKIALKETRKGQERGHNTKGTFFGQNLELAQTSGRIAVGDILAVEEVAEESNVILAVA